MFVNFRGAPEPRHPLKHGFSGLNGYGKDTKQHGTWASRAKLKGRRSQVIYSGLTLLMKFHQFLQDIRCGWCHLWVCKVDKIGKREREKKRAGEEVPGGEEGVHMCSLWDGTWCPTALCPQHFGGRRVIQLVYQELRRQISARLDSNYPRMSQTPSNF